MLKKEADRLKKEQKLREADIRKQSLVVDLIGLTSFLFVLILFTL